MKQKNLIFILVAAVLLVVCPKGPSRGENWSANGDDGWLHASSSLYIASGTDICIHANSLFSIDALHNNGNVYFSSSEGLETHFSEGDAGSGDFYFVGEGGHSIYTSDDNSAIGSLIVDSQSDVYLTGDLIVNSTLDLRNGTMVVDKAKILTVLNEDPQAILFDNSVLNPSYVVGNLARAIAENGTYFFPVGSISGFHPFLLSEVSRRGRAIVEFDPTIPATWANSQSDQASYELLPEVGWRLNTDFSDQSNFGIGLSLIDRNGDLQSSEFGVFSTENDQMLNSQVNWNVTKSNIFFIESVYDNAMGLFALARDQEKIKLANFFLLGSGGSSHFEIPNASKYSNIELLVYNRLGNLVFRSNKYLNELDVNDFPDGTYFYELTLHEGAESKRIRNFLEIHHEK